MKTFRNVYGFVTHNEITYEYFAKLYSHITSYSATRMGKHLEFPYEFESHTSWCFETYPEIEPLPYDQVIFNEVSDKILERENG